MSSTLVLLSSDNSSSASFEKYLRPSNLVPSWKQCRKAVKRAIGETTTAPLEVELPLPSFPSEFDWRIYVANHEWCEDLLRYGGIIRATCRRHRKTRDYHLFLFCADGSSFMVTTNTLRRIDTSGNERVMKYSDKAVKIAFREALEGIRKGAKRGAPGESEGVVAQFNASIRDMMADFIKDIIIGVPLGNPTNSDWVKLIDNPEVVKVEEDDRMIPKLVDTDMEARWVEYVRANFKIMRMSQSQAERLGQLKNDNAQAASNTEGLPAIAAKISRQAPLLPVPSLEADTDVVLEPGQRVSIRLQPGVVSFKPFAFFVHVATDESSGYLQVSKAPYNDEPLLQPISPSPAATQRYETADADRAHLRSDDARPRRPLALDTPTTTELSDIPSLSRDEFILCRLDDSVDYGENSTSRGWQLSCHGNSDPQEPLAWHGAEFTLKGSQRRDFGAQKVLIRLQELEGNLSIGLSECEDPLCVCRRKYPGGKQGKKCCRKAVGFNSDGVKWNRGRAVQMNTGNIQQGDLLALVLVSAGSDKFARVEIGVSRHHTPAEILPVKLESDAPAGGRLILRASGRFTIDLLLGEGSVSETPHAPLWQALPVLKEEPEAESDCDMPDA